MGLGGLGFGGVLRGFKEGLVVFYGKWRLWRFASRPKLSVRKSRMKVEEGVLILVHSGENLNLKYAQFSCV